MKIIATPFALGSRPLWGALLALACALAPLANAEISIGLYAGQSFVDDGDLHVSQGKTNLEFSGVSWNDKSFESPILYGIRLGYWLESAPNWGWSIDYDHIKNYLEYDKTAHISGTDMNGNAVNGVQPISNYIEDFNMSHGVNTITFNGMHRWFLGGQRDNSLLGRMQVYMGFGAGFSVPHVEATINNVRTFEYQTAAGPVVDGKLGLNYDLLKHLSVFGEYKLNYVEVDDDLKGGGILSTETVNHQLNFGLAVNFDL